MRAVGWLLVCLVFAFAPASDAAKRKKKRKKPKAAVEAVVPKVDPEAAAKAERLRKAEEEAEKEAKAVAAMPRHPSFGIVVMDGAVEASEKSLRGLGLDAFDGYKVGAFFTNAKAKDVVLFYMKTLQKTVKKEKGDTTLRYTLMIEVPSGDNPLGEKVIIDENEGGVKDESGAHYKTLITVYRKIGADVKKPDADAPAAPKADEGPKPAK